MPRSVFRREESQTGDHGLVEYHFKSDKLQTDYEIMNYVMKFSF